jgi:hypothetical protein
MLFSSAKCKAGSGLLCVAMIVVAGSLSCGGSIGGPDDDPLVDGEYPGIPAGTPVTAQIGSAGGTLQTPDGDFSMVIPAGALSKTTSITVSPLLNTAPNGFGLSYHIEPAALKLAQPARITLRVSEAELENLPADWVGVGVRNRSGAWFGDTRSTVELSAASVAASPSRTSAVGAQSSRDRVVSVTHVESSDGDWVEYTLFAFWQITPPEASVEVGGSTIIRVLACLREDETGSSGNEDLLAGLPICKPSIRQGTWRVNGIVAGNSSVGVVHTDPGSNGSEVLYIAPNTIPSANPVSVVASMYWPRRNVTKVFNNPPVKITIVGKELTGSATGSVVSAVTSVGTLYDYTAKITWTRVQAPVVGGISVYRPQGYVKYTARNRCISAMSPDSVAIGPNDARLEISAQDSSWTAEGGGLSMPQIRYFDTCQRMNSILEFSGAPYILDGGEQKLPVQGTIKLDFGLKITGSFKYVREGESP